MSELSQNLPPQDLPSSSYFTVFVEPETFDIYFKCGWGRSLEDLSSFASLLYKVNSGNYEEEILQEIERQCSRTGGDGEEQFFAFLSFYDQLKLDAKKSDLVVRPSQVKFE